MPEQPIEPVHGKTSGHGSEAHTNSRGGDAHATHGGEAQPSHGSGISSLITMPFLIVASATSMLWNALTRDGVLAGAARQGADELGAALKAFPDSIQVQETGTIWNPTSAEIYDSRHDGLSRGSSTHYSNLTPPPRADRQHEQVDNGHCPPSDTSHGEHNGQVLTQQRPPGMSYGDWLREQGKARPEGMGYGEWIKQQEKGSQDGNAEADQSERGKGRSLPDEEREKKQEQDRGRGR